MPWAGAGLQAGRVVLRHVLCVLVFAFLQDKPLLYGVDVSSSKMFKSQRVRAAAAFAAVAHAGQVGSAINSRPTQQEGGARAPASALARHCSRCSGTAVGLSQMQQRQQPSQGLLLVCRNPSLPGFCRGGWERGLDPCAVRLQHHADLGCAPCVVVVVLCVLGCRCARRASRMSRTALRLPSSSSPTCLTGGRTAGAGTRQANRGGVQHLNSPWPSWTWNPPACTQCARVPCQSSSATARHSYIAQCFFAGMRPQPWCVLVVADTLFWCLHMHLHCRHEIAVIAALLHDTLDDTATTPEALCAAFGPTVTAMVVSVSKLSAVNQMLRRDKRKVCGATGVLAPDCHAAGLHWWLLRCIAA